LGVVTLVNKDLQISWLCQSSRRAPDNTDRPFIDWMYPVAASEKPRRRPAKLLLSNGQFYTAFAGFPAANGVMASSAIQSTAAATSTRSDGQHPEQRCAFSAAAGDALGMSFVMQSRAC
jgi:hypothetical protein